VDDELVDIAIRIESTTDALTALAVHHLVGSLVDRVLDQGEDLLRVNVAESIKGLYGTEVLLESHVAQHPVFSDSEGFMGSIGIPSIPENRRRTTTGSSDPADYVLFKDRGTGMFGSEGHPIYGVNHVMKFPGMDDEDVYRRSVKGQEGAEFTRRTYEEMFEALPADVEIFEREIKSLS
jgi:hypothetical protein